MRRIGLLLLLAQLASATFELYYPPPRRVEMIYRPGTEVPNLPSDTFIPPVNMTVPRNSTLYPPTGLQHPCTMRRTTPRKDRTVFSLNGHSPLSFYTLHNRSTVHINMAITSDVLNATAEDWIQLVPHFYLYGEGDICWAPFIPRMLGRDPKRDERLAGVQNGTLATIMVVVADRDGLAWENGFHKEGYACSDVVLVDELPYPSPSSVNPNNSGIPWSWKVSCQNDTEVTTSDWLYAVDESGNKVDRRLEVEEDWHKRYNSSSSAAWDGSSANRILMVSSLAVTGAAIFGLQYL
ncbi:hypothetical protein BJ508DRAFT_379242 [Ascobolus immersus RN42]|uniref:Copper acquisition factor BIM1-like domain-containing protein n=1 Tax=Ascobolus immersus RN42 TaxID=1160509 RepID=A0A3N4HUU8_ASCIM|nr:hypothetical protein BJ508DRAFT_379242 [Ascobolus immersus RN42]